MKADKILGQQIHEHLIKIGMETPMTPQAISPDTLTVKSNYSTQEKIDKIEAAFKDIMKALELDLTDDSLEETPHRVAKMYVNELYKGLDYSHFPKCTTIQNKMDAGMVIERNIKVMSGCEHHFVTIDGMATVAYIPKHKVLGLSKLNRIVNFFSRRPQVQERLTNQIWHTLNYILETDDVAVYVDAVHFCVRSRGVEDGCSSTITNKLGGVFMSDPAVRAEFMAIATKG